MGFLCQNRLKELPFDQARGQLDSGVRDQKQRIPLCLLERVVQLLFVRVPGCRIGRTMKKMTNQMRQKFRLLLVQTREPCVHSRTTPTPEASSMMNLSGLASSSSSV